MKLLKIKIVNSNNKVFVRTIKIRTHFYLVKVKRKLIVDNKVIMSGVKDYCFRDDMNRVYVFGRLRGVITDIDIARKSLEYISDNPTNIIYDLEDIMFYQNPRIRDIL